MNEFLTWDVLASFGGSLAAVVLFTQAVKKYALPKVSPVWIAMAFALVVQIGVQLVFRRDFTAEGIYLAVFNWVVLWVSAMGSFDAIKTGAKKLKHDTFGEK